MGKRAGSDLPTDLPGVGTAVLVAAGVLAVKSVTYAFKACRDLIKAAHSKPDARHIEVHNEVTPHDEAWLAREMVERREILAYLRDH